MNSLEMMEDGNIIQGFFLELCFWIFRVWERLCLFTKLHEELTFSLQDEDIILVSVMIKRSDSDDRGELHQKELFQTNIADM